MLEMTPEIQSIRREIESKHGGDAKQLEVIFSEHNRLLVEAPAGYGKTHTMVSRIAYLIATGKIPTPKRLLALTFSVNAAYKIKKDVAKNIPELLRHIDRNINIRDKSYTSNYHGFCRGVLKKYGHLLHSSLKNIDTLDTIDDSNLTNLSSYNLLDHQIQTLINFNASVKQSQVKVVEDNFEIYNAVVIDNLLSNNSITYNAIITLTIKLFKDYQNILEFYQNYYTTILVDEFQDTNTLSYLLLNTLVCDNTSLLLLGDSLQRIYGFIGAVPDLMKHAKNKFNMVEITLDRNYRFASNPNMLQLDKIIRQNAITPYQNPAGYSSNINFVIHQDQPTEAVEVVKKALSIIHNDIEASVAILVKQRGGNVNCIINTFNQNNIPFFYGLFSDEDAGYIGFNQQCLSIFTSLVKEDRRITKKISRKHLAQLIIIYNENNTPIVDSSLKLLSVFWNRLFIDYIYLSNDDKINLIMDTFGHNGLKQYMEYLDAKIIISTVHAAKGLEWSHVILPDMEQDSFPSYIGSCKYCICKRDCNIIINGLNEKAYLEELSVFYVAVTRARKEIYFTASKKQDRGFSKNISCFMRLPGLNINA